MKVREEWSSLFIYKDLGLKMIFRSHYGVVTSRHFLYFLNVFPSNTILDLPVNFQLYFTKILYIRCPLNHLLPRHQRLFIDTPSYSFFVWFSFIKGRPLRI